MDKKTGPTHMLPTRDSPQNRRPTQTESEGWKKIFQANGQEKKARVAIFIADKIDFKTKAIKRDTEEHFMIHKNPSRRHKHCKHICTQHRSTQIHKENLGGLQESYKQQYTHVGNFNTPLSTMDGSSKQNINKDIVELNDALDQVYLTGVCVCVCVCV